MKISQIKKVEVEVEVEARTLCLHIRVTDQLKTGLEDQYGNEIFSQNGELPDFVPGSFFGDYLVLRMNIDTGQVMNWEVPMPKQLQDWVNGEGGE